MRGQDCKTYYSTVSIPGGAYASPTWNEIKRVVNDTITPSGEEISGANRQSEYGSTDVGTKRLSGELTYEYKDIAYDGVTGGGQDPIFIAFRSAFLNNTIVDMLFADQAYATGSGWRAPMKCTEMPIKRDLNGVVEVTLTLKSTTWDDSGTIREPKAWSAGADL